MKEVITEKNLRNRKTTHCQYAKVRSPWMSHRKSCCPWSSYCWHCRRYSRPLTFIGISKSLFVSHVQHGAEAGLLLNVANYHKQMNSCPVQRVRTGAWPFTVDWAPRCLFKTWQCVLMRTVMTGLDFRGICPLLMGNTHINIPIPFFSHTVWSVSESEQQLLNMKLNYQKKKKVKKKGKSACMKTSWKG